MAGLGTWGLWLEGSGGRAEKYGLYPAGKGWGFSIGKSKGNVYQIIPFSSLR